MKGLHKSERNKKIFGVCGGVAETFGLDATVVRIIWGVSALAFGFGGILYLVLAIALPSKY